MCGGQHGIDERTRAEQVRVPQVRREDPKGHASCVGGEVCANSVISKIKKLKITLDTAGVVRDGSFKTSPSCSAVEDTDHSPSGPRWSDRFFARCSTCARDVSQDTAKRHFSAPPRPPLQPAHQNRYRSAQPRDALKMGRD